MIHPSNQLPCSQWSHNILKDGSLRGGNYGILFYLMECFALIILKKNGKKEEDKFH
jgi:hypothetical protein